MKSLSCNLGIAAAVLAWNFASPQGGAIDSTVMGSGKLVMRGKADQYFKKARVVLNQNGRAEVYIFTDPPTVLVGTWSSNPNGTCAMRLLRFGSNGASGDGTIQHNGRSVMAFEITGVTHSSQFELSFKAG